MLSKSLSVLTVCGGSRRRCLAGSKTGSVPGGALGISAGWEQLTGRWCVCTYDGVLSACREARGEKWGWLCSSLSDTCASAGGSGGGTTRRALREEEEKEEANSSGIKKWLATLHPSFAQYAGVFVGLGVEDTAMLATLTDQAVDAVLAGLKRAVGRKTVHHIELKEAMKRVRRGRTLG